MRKRTLGKGLGELLSGEPLPHNRAVLDVPVHRLSPNPRQPRVDLHDDRLEELTLSIEAHGVLQPIIVRTVGDDHEIIAGERRWRAAQRAGLQTVPCIVVDATDEKSLEYALVENVQREDLNAVEAARGYRHLIDDFGLTQDRLAQLIGKSRSAIANTLRLLDLPAAVLDAVRVGGLSEGHGRALLGLAGAPDELVRVSEIVQEQGCTVRETERLVRESLAPAPAQALAEEVSPERADPNLRDAQERMQLALATKVTVRPSPRGGGRIEIRYASEEEFQRLLELLAMLG